MRNIFENESYQAELQVFCQSEPLLQELEGKRILITGGTGLIGSGMADILIYYNEHYARRDIQLWILSRGIQTAEQRFHTVWEKDYFHFMGQDIREPILLQESVDLIVHAAGKGDPGSMMSDPAGIIDANVLGTRQVLELTRQQKSCRMVFVSSGEVYGSLDTVEKAGIRETNCGKLDTLKVRSCYGLSKRMGENLCVSYMQEYDIRVTIARLSHTYGVTAMADESRVIFQFLQKARRGEDIVLKSAGTQVRSWTYLSDAVRGILTVLLKGENGQAYNVSNGEASCSIRDLAEQIANAAGIQVIEEKPTEQEQGQGSGIEYAVLNDEKLKALGCEMKVGIHEGIRRMLTF